MEFKGGAGRGKRLPHCCRPVLTTLTSPPASRTPRSTIKAPSLKEEAQPASRRFNSQSGPRLRRGLEKAGCTVPFPGRGCPGSPRGLRGRASGRCRAERVAQVRPPALPAQSRTAHLWRRRAQVGVCRGAGGTVVPAIPPSPCCAGEVGVRFY